MTIGLTDRTFFHEIEGKYDLESELEIYLQFFLTDENLNSKILKTKNGTLIMQSKCTECKFWKVDLFSKYAGVVPLKDKRGITIVNGFQLIISKGRKPNKTWVDQSGELYNKLFKRFLKITNIEMYSTYKYNEGKFVAAERFFWKLKDEIFQHMTAISNFDLWDDIVNKYNNTVHRTIKMKLIDVTSDSYGKYNEDSNVPQPKFKFGDHVRISKYKNIFAKGYTQNLTEEIFFGSKIKNTVLSTYVISDLNGEPIAGSFYEK